MDKQTLKRLHEDTDSETETTSWPRFLIIEGTDLGHPLQNLSPFAIHKGILGIAGEPVSVKKLRSGQILIEVNKEHHARNLLKCRTFVQVPVKVSAHKSLNTKKGIIRCADLRECDDDDILDELKSQGVVRIQRMMFTRDGMKRPTNTFIVTFGEPTLPEYIAIGYLKVKVDMFIPNPIRCFNCQKFGHFRSNCKQEEVCPNCGQKKHGPGIECPNASVCVNCSGRHSANSKECPRWQQEKAIQKLKCELNVSYPEAKKRLSNTQTTTTGKLYAAAASSVKTRTIETQTTVTWPNENKHPKVIENPRSQNCTSSIRVSHAATNTNKADNQNRQSQVKGAQGGASNKTKKNKNKKDGNLQKGPSVSIVHDNIFSALSSDDDEGMETNPPSQGEKNHKTE